MLFYTVNNYYPNLTGLGPDKGSCKYIIPRIGGQFLDVVCIEATLIVLNSDDGWEEEL